MLNKKKGKGGKQSGVITVSTTSDNRETLVVIARRLIDEKLVSCGQIMGPVRSIYWWKGAVQEADEWLLLMKTKKKLYRKVQEEIIRLHPYEVPEIVAYDICDGSKDYLGWIQDTTRVL